jgi:nitroimidazol reductase NimA-like FMN-containing flavoprotein (pyridoxamine 5'-phosphate oxidase superfamily)
MSEEFTPTDLSRLRRAHHRGHFDRETIYGILDSTFLCHVGYVLDGRPMVTPTIHWRDGDRIYWHGSAASRMIRTVEGGAPVCITVSHLDGLVVARSGFHCSANYRSVMAFGHAHAIEDEEHKEAALRHFIDGLLPGRWAEMREPTDQEMKGTTVCYMDIEEASAKVRTGAPIDDEDDYAADCWAGVVPFSQTVGTPIPDPRLRPGIPLPANVAGFKLDGSGR